MKPLVKITNAHRVEVMRAIRNILRPEFDGDMIELLDANIAVEELKLDYARIISEVAPILKEGKKRGLI